ncbi:MAG: UDP-N-acetylglucosamine 1-carboxyvinyltransferase [Elusimicrobiales bacterium]|nr:UDP-N-acetylglucosamine 1-carboxyvinyltransferase [Elusimicrobiales bacterium]
MDNFVINGVKSVSGNISISGSKNAALPIIISSLLTSEKVEIENVPKLRDVQSTLELLNYLGKKCSFKGNKFTISENHSLKHYAPYDLVRKMRASVLVAGPLLARFKQARFSLPGGCTIGVRPVDIHLESFKKFGACISYSGGDVVISAKRLKAAHIKLKFPSVGATENLMMCAVLIKGKTILENCAKEPEIKDLADCLRKMGARIEGDGSSVIKIMGVKKLTGVKYSVMPDRIETGTFMILSAVIKGEINLLNTSCKNLAIVAKFLKRSGVKIKDCGNSVKIISSGKRPKPVSFKTAPYPGFPTDLQALWLAYMCRAKGKSTIHESIFENRFMHVGELMRMGAKITVTEETAVITGIEMLKGAPIMASDIRAGAALIVAATAASGKSTIRRIYHIDRGYDQIEEKMSSVGFKINRRKG